jgi:uncharacterized membrane protein
VAKKDNDVPNDPADEPTEDAIVLSDEVEARIETEVEARFEQLTLERYSSQFPHPEHLERYVNLYPDAAKLIFDNFDKQSEHRRDMERLFVKGNESRANRGQWLAFSIVIVTIGVGLVSVLNGNATAGGIIIGAAFAGGVVLYIAGGGTRTQGPMRTQGPNERDSARGTSGRTRKSLPPESTAD